MTLRNVRTLFLSSLTTSFVVTGCFLVIGDIPEGSDGAHAGDASASGGNGGSGGISGSSGSASGGISGAGASAGDGGVGGVSGSAGMAGSGASAGTGGSGGATCINPPCDCDGDGYGKPGCVPEPHDCDDTDPDAFPGQQLFFGEERNSGGYDYNCNTLFERDGPDIDCGLLGLSTCKAPVPGYYVPPPPCGTNADFGVCKKNGLGVCVAEVQQVQKKVLCH